MRNLLHSKAPANHPEHGLRFGQFQCEAHGKKDEAVDAKHGNAEKNRPTRANEEEQAPKEKEQASRGRSGKQRCDPNLRKKGERHADLSNAAADAALQQSEF